MPTQTLAELLHAELPRLRRRLKRIEVAVWPPETVEHIMTHPRWGEAETAYADARRVVEAAAARGPLHRRLADGFEERVALAVGQLLLCNEDDMVESTAALFDDTGRLSQLSGAPMEINGALRAAAGDTAFLGSYGWTNPPRILRSLAKAVRRRYLLCAEEAGVTPAQLPAYEQKLRGDLRAVLNRAWDEVAPGVRRPRMQLDMARLGVTDLAAGLYAPGSWPRATLMLRVPMLALQMFKVDVAPLPGISPKAARDYHACAESRAFDGSILDGEVSMPLHVVLHELLHANSHYTARVPGDPIDDELAHLLVEQLSADDDIESELGSPSDLELVIEFGTTRLYVTRWALTRLSEPAPARLSLMNLLQRMVGIPAAGGLMGLNEGLTELATFELIERLPDHFGPWELRPGTGIQAYRAITDFVRQIMPADRSALDLLHSADSLSVLRSGLRARALTAEAVVAIEDELFNRRGQVSIMNYSVAGRRWLGWLDADAASVTADLALDEPPTSESDLEPAA